MFNTNLSIILVDNYGNKTRMIARNALKLKEEIGFKSIIVLSQYYHLKRTKMLLITSGSK